MNRPLLVEKSLSSGKSEDPFVPDIRVDIKPLVSGKSKADEVLRLDIVGGQRERHEERPLVEGEKELTSIGMIIGVPE